MQNIALLYIGNDGVKSTEEVHVLRGKRFDVTFTSTADAGLKTLYETPFHAVMCDLDMPDTHDLWILHQIQTYFPEIPVIVLTTPRSLALAVEAIKIGAYEIALKPLNLGKLETMIHNAITEFAPAANDSINFENWA